MQTCAHTNTNMYKNTDSMHARMHTNTNVYTITRNKKIKNKLQEEPLGSACSCHPRNMLKAATGNYIRPAVTLDKVFYSRAPLTVSDAILF